MPTAKVITVDQPTALYCHHSGQYRMQPCHLALDLGDGELSCDYNSEIGTGIPMSVYHGRVLWAPIPTLTADTANRLMESVREDAQLVLDGSEIEWDGHNNIGRLTDDARAAWERIVEVCDPQNCTWSDDDYVGEYDAAGWFVGGEGTAATLERLGVTADTTDEQIEAMAKAETEDALTCGPGITILQGAEEWLTGQREELRAQVADEAERIAAELESLVQRRNEVVRRMAGWGEGSGYSLRTIATLVHRTHPWVSNLLRQPSPDTPVSPAGTGRELAGRQDSQ